MLDVTEAMARICKGPVVWVAAVVTRKRNYWPACEGLMWEWWKRHGTHELYRPCVFHRVGIPGSGGKDWFRADWEYVMCFKRPGALAWSDNTACGHPPKWAPGGEMSHRISDGTRVNQWGKNGSDTASGVKVSESGHVTSRGTRPSHVNANRGPFGETNNNRGCNGRRASGEYKMASRKVQTRRKKDGTRPGELGHDGMHNQEQDYEEPVLANPGNVFHLAVGGGVMGDKLCHENEAPFPEKLAEIFVRSLCPEGGIVLDPFSGSGTTLAVSRQWGRRGIGIDLRESQSDIAAKRLAQQVLFTE